ncbi:hypothetical protein, variant [Verruconis gallopava]|uniref:PH domain-containing protein n=1 Tax=Verruconis gallopava TaxID=253628 RepID=A0A0D1XMI9_9PEZI|nr:uncharacterized protein PV09_05039 [Verruconis gallopava]XP_016213601.1 hypothetical protein, variant [Verruconis gallopava]KIW03731.1 hypothetical protein PV09_05039 [Verruconis gallopava]KIW03732.1 hypothetical protein, variant [Verruconis gallopava]
MTQAVAKYAAKKMLSKQLKDYKNKDPAGPYDPYYEYRIDPRSGRKKKMKKQIPAYIPEHDANVLARVRKTAYRLDCSLFSLFGIRFGVSSVIGLIPAIGDGVDGALALNTVRKCNKIEGGLPQSVLIQMLFWVFIDFIVGIVPFVGDLLDASIKANSKNCRILEEHLDKKYKPRELVAQEKRERDEAKRASRPYIPPAPATVYEDIDDDDDAGLPRYEDQRPYGGPTAPVAQPQPARQKEERRGGSRPERSGSKGWFGGGGGGTRAQRPNGAEMSQARR